MYKTINNNIDGPILSFYQYNDTKTHYIQLDQHEFVDKVTEKKSRSNIATVGVYYWKHGSDFIKYAKQMIMNFIYVQYIIIPHFCKKMWNLGTSDNI